MLPSPSSCWTLSLITWLLHSSAIRSNTCHTHSSLPENDLQETKTLVTHSQHTASWYLTVPSNSQYNWPPIVQPKCSSITRPSKESLSFTLCDNYVSISHLSHTWCLLTRPWAGQSWVRYPAGARDFSAPKRPYQLAPHSVGTECSLKGKIARQ